MPSRFATSFGRTAAPSLVKQFGESVTYHPSGGSDRSIDAIVERRESAILQEVGDLNIKSVIVRVLDDSTDGIALTELDTGGDEITVAMREGDTASQRPIVRLLQGSNGFTRVLVQ